MKKASILTIGFLFLWYSSIAQQHPKMSRKVFSEDFKSDPISLESSAYLIESLLSDNSLKNLVTTHGFGGVFSSATFSVTGPGVLLWYCYNPDSLTNHLPKFFLALEQTNFDSAHIVKMADTLRPGISSKLLDVPSVFKYVHNGNTMGDAIDFISKQNTKIATAPAKLSATSVRLFVQHFKSLMSIISPQNRTFCVYPFAYFTKNPALIEFMKSPYYVRYYIGLAMDKDHKPNYLRPILAGAKQDGSTIAATKNDGPLIQKSIPPPPYN